MCRNNVDALPCLPSREILLLAKLPANLLFHLIVDTRLHLILPSSSFDNDNEINFNTHYTQPVSVYWVDTKSNQKVHNALLKSGEKHTNFIKTFIGHIFEVYDTLPDQDDALNNALLYNFTVQNHGVIGINNHKQPSLPKEHVAQEVQRTLNHEWVRHSKVKRTFSPLGFDIGRLPDDLFASLGSYYYNNRERPHVVHEEWGKHKVRLLFVISTSVIVKFDR